VQRLTDRGSGNFLFTAALTGPEMIAAIVRRARGGHLPPPEAGRGVASLRRDWHSLLFVIDIDDPIVARAMDIAEAHALRGYDAVHVAAALESQSRRHAQGLPALTFVSADQEQLQAAAAEGLLTGDPNRHP
jgi:uncharacterized protein